MLEDEEKKNVRVYVQLLLLLLFEEIFMTHNSKKEENRSTTIFCFSYLEAYTKKLSYFFFFSPRLYSWIINKADTTRLEWRRILTKIISYSMYIFFQ